MKAILLVVVSFLSHFYELCFRVYHYDYREISNPEYNKKLSFHEKIVCLREYDSEEMQAVLSGKRGGVWLAGHLNKTVERVVIDGKEFIVKTHAYPGFWQNLFVRGRGVTIWNNGLMARNKKLQTLKPVALMEKWGWAGSVSKVVYPMDGRMGEESSECLLSVENLVEQMVQLRFFMRDFSLENIVFLEAGQPQLIDIGRLFAYPKYSLVFRGLIHEEIERFNEERPLIQDHQLPFWDFLMREFSSIYQKCWPIFHYDYAGMDSSEYVKRWGFREKVFCHKGHFTPAMERFLQGEDEQVRGLMSEHEGYVTERIELDGKAYIVKTTERRGFLKNLFQMSAGVKVWNNGHLAKRVGLPTLIPVALVERRGWRSSESLVVYPMEGSILEDVMKKRDDLMPAVQDVVKKMREAGMIHAEFRPVNAVYLEERGVQLVDIDDLHAYPRWSYLCKKRLEIEVKRFNKKARLGGLQGELE